MASGFLAWWKGIVLDKFCFFMWAIERNLRGKLKLKNVKQETIIYSDCWKSFNDLEKKVGLNGL